MMALSHAYFLGRHSNEDMGEDCPISQGFLKTKDSHVL